MARNLTTGSPLGTAVRDLHTQLLDYEHTDGTWPGIVAVTLLDDFFQRVGLQNCDGCGSAAGEDCHPNCLSSPTGHDHSEGAPA